ncbi:MAG: phosphate signaling complex protein PhoU [Anaerolineales bacterium]|nr:MAG: phosphate signaling complex protein PhoU [Anaerolineales bacterium]
MLRQTYERDLQRLQDDVLALGGMVEEAITASVASLKRRDMEASERVIAQDQAINQKRFGIERDVLVLIATQQPMASDLRVLAAILAIISELERIGDYAKGIARINLMIGPEPLVKPLVDIPRMAEKARDMLHRALVAFAERDTDLARAIPEEDDEVDDLYNQVYRELITYIITDPRTLDQANYLMWAAHNLERAADRVTNICERVVFTVTGEMIELDHHPEKDLADRFGADTC